MDKLELDARVARLERCLAWHSTLILGFLLLIAAGLLLTMLARSDSRPAVASLVTPLRQPTLAPPSPVPTTVEVRTMPVEDPAPQGCLTELGRHLEELRSLQGAGLLSEDEYGAKKRRLLARPFEPTSLKSDLKQLGDLRRREVLSEDEYVEIKERVLEAQH